jgi:serine/threonine-protein kinase
VTRLRFRFDGIDRLGLLPRIALTLGAVGLLPVLIATAGLSDFNRDALNDQVLLTHIVAARTAADRVAALLSSREALARSAAGSPELADPGSPAAQQYLARSLQTWTGLGVLGAGVLNAEGETVFRVQVKGEGERVAAALEPRSGGPWVPGVSPPVLRFTAPLPQGAGSLVLVCDGAALSEIGRPEELGSQAQLVLLDRAGGGRVVAGSVHSVAELPARLAALALSGQVSGAGPYQVGGETVIAAYFPVPGTQWVVLSLQPAATAKAVALRLRRQTAYGLGAAVLLVLALSSGAWVTLVRPLRELVVAQRGLVGDKSAPASGDEIADLRRTFEVLQRSLAERRELDNVFLGRYQVIEALGTGAMGTVFRGWDPRLQRPVALKTIKLAGILEPDKRKELIATLTREAVTVARLNHPNVVAVYDLEDAPETAFIAMELVDGMTLEALLGRRRRLTPDEVIPLGAAIARGLAAAHAQDIVHRDVKPANVLLGKDGSIKVSDFGIAGFLAASAQEGDVVFGTPGYLPPESLRGGVHGKRGDLFSFGVVLYTCLAGTMPFGMGTEAADLLRATLFGPVRPLSRVMPGVPAELESLIGVLLERDEARRPSSAEALAAELDRMAAVRGLRWRFEPGTTDAKAADAEPFPAQWVPTTRLGASGPGGGGHRLS